MATPSRPAVYEEMQLENLKSELAEIVREYRVVTDLLLANDVNCNLVLLARSFRLEKRMADKDVEIAQAQEELDNILAVLAFS